MELVARPTETQEDSDEVGTATAGWHTMRLQVLSTLVPYRFLKHVLTSIPHEKVIDHNSYYDTLECAALFIDISGFSKITEILFKKYGLEGAETLAKHLNVNLGAPVCAPSQRHGLFAAQSLLPGPQL